MYQCGLQVQEHLQVDKTRCCLRLRECLLRVLSSLLIFVFSFHQSLSHHVTTATRKTCDFSLYSCDLKARCKNLTTPADSLPSLPLVELLSYLSNRIRFLLLTLAHLGDCATCHCSIYLGFVSYHSILDVLPPFCLTDQQACVEAARQNNASESACRLLLCSVLIAPRRLSLASYQLLAP